jgi:hypothetical protein
VVRFLAAVANSATISVVLADAIHSTCAIHFSGSVADCDRLPPPAVAFGAAPSTIGVSRPSIGHPSAARYLRSVRKFAPTVAPPREPLAFRVARSCSPRMRSAASGADIGIALNPGSHSARAFA